MTYLFDDFLTFGILGFFLLGRDGHFHFARDFEAGNDTRLHCLGTVEPSGFCF